MMGKDPKTEEDWDEKGGGRGPGQTEADPKHTQKIDRYDWGGNPTEKSWMPKKGK